MGQIVGVPEYVYSRLYLYDGISFLEKLQWTPLYIVLFLSLQMLKIFNLNITFIIFGRVALIKQVLDNAFNNTCAIRKIMELQTLE